MEIYRLATDSNLSLQDRCTKLTALLAVLKDEILLKNEKVVSRHLRAVENKTGFLRLKDKDAALSIWTDFFKETFKNYRHLQSFEWSQREDYNDNYMYYSVDNFRLNESGLGLYFGLDGFDFIRDDWYISDEEKRMFVWDLIYEEAMSDSEVEKYWTSNTEKHMHTIYEKFMLAYKQPIDSILVLFQSLYNAYTADYFVSLFGWEAAIKITPEGIFITN